MAAKKAAAEQKEEPVKKAPKKVSEADSAEGGRCSEEEGSRRWAREKETCRHSTEKKTCRGSSGKQTCRRHSQKETPSRGRRSEERDGRR